MVTKGKDGKMAAPTIGQQTAALIGFIAFTLLLQPVVQLIVPAATYNAYYGSNGIVTSTSSNWNTKFATPVLTNANSSSSGFFASQNIVSSIFAPFAFVYAGIGLFWKSLWNMPSMLQMIFTSLSSNVVLLPVAISSVAMIGILGYILIGDFYKLFSMLMKSDAENIGS